MKMVCYYCDEITTCSCPEDSHHSDAKFVCDICMRLMEEGVPEDQLKNSSKREEVKKSMHAEEEEDHEFIVKAVEGTFDEIWSVGKKYTKELSKKDVAKYFYAVGMASAFDLMHEVAVEAEHEMLENKGQTPKLKQSALGEDMGEAEATNKPTDVEHK